MTDSGTNKLSTKLFLVILLGVSVIIALGYLWYRHEENSVDGFYTVVDTFVDRKESTSTSVHFVRVDAYDTTKILRVAEKITREAVEQGTLPISDRRQFLFHFFMASDTHALTPNMVEELAYSNPSIENPARTLYLVQNGYVVQAVFAASLHQPQKVQLTASDFYLPRPGIHARDVK